MIMANNGKRAFFITEIVPWILVCCSFEKCSVFMFHANIASHRFAQQLYHHGRTSICFGLWAWRTFSKQQPYTKTYQRLPDWTNIRTCINAVARPDELFTTQPLLYAFAFISVRPTPELRFSPNIKESIVHDPLESYTTSEVAAPQYAYLVCVSTCVCVWLRVSGRVCAHTRTMMSGVRIKCIVQTRKRTHVVVHIEPMFIHPLPHPSLYAWTD